MNINYNFKINEFVASENAFFSAAFSDKTSVSPNAVFISGPTDATD